MKAVQCGDYHTVCLFDDGSVYSWGGSHNNKMGKRVSMLHVNMPGLITYLKSKVIKEIACGDFHTLARD